MTHLAVPYYCKVLKLPSWKYISHKAKLLARSKPDEEDAQDAVNDGLPKTELEVLSANDTKLYDKEGFPSIPDDETDFRKEAAYNLAQIYVLSGTPALAQHLLRKYCTI